jgi:hypothetical protein
MLLHTGLAPGELRTGICAKLAGTAAASAGFLHHCSSYCKVGRNSRHILLFQRLGGQEQVVTLGHRALV